MKKILFFALILGITTQAVGQRPGGPGQSGAQQRPPVAQSNVQNKDAENALKAYEKAKTEVAGKKAQDAASWVRLGKSIISVYELPSKNLLVGLSPLEVRVVLKDQRSTGTTHKTIDGEEYEVVSYPDKDLYYNANGQLAFWVVTKTLLPQDLLNEAFDAFNKGYEFDAKGSQKKALFEEFSNLQRRYVTDAMTANSMGNHSLSSKNFGGAVRCSEHPIVNAADTLIMYYTGYTAFWAQEYERAIHYFQRAADLGYTHEGGVYSFLAECYKALDQKEKAGSVLSEGFTKYPSNQAILVSLINMYMENDDDSAKLMDLIHKAQENEPTNESLYYAEGNVWKKLNNTDKALECYLKSVEVNPKYMFGYYSVGSAYYDSAVELSNKASEELDDRKWLLLMEEADKFVVKSIEPFEMAFSLTTDVDIQKEIALILRTIYYRMQGKDEAYKPLFEKYRDFLEK